MKAAVLMCLIACGGSPGSDDTGDDGGGDTVAVIPSGGVDDSPLAGTLHVYAVETNSSTPIASATVQVGSLTGSTSSSGLVTFSDASLTGKVTITVSALGHAAATWVGVANSNVTIPLEATPRVVPTATATGTITGWPLSTPSFGHYNLAVILYSFLDDPSAPENSLTQPATGGVPADTCVDSGSGNRNCAWSLLTRVGSQVHFALILDGDAHLTANDTSDDTYTLIGYAVGSPTTLTAGQTMSGEALTMVTTTQNFKVTFPAAPSGLGTTIAIPELELDSGAGRIVFPEPAITPGNTTLKVITPTGSFAGHYELVALATPNPTATTPYATGFVHAIAGTGATVPAWFPVPTGVNAGSTFSFGGTGAFATAQISRSKKPLWDFTILDGSTTVTLPTVSPDPIGSGAADLSVNIADVPSFDAGKFDVASTTASLARIAGAQAAFTH